MHIVTKVLVVFAAVLAVFLSALTIAYSSNADRIVTDYTTEQSARISAEAALAAERAQSGQEQTRIRAEAQQLAQTVADRDAKIRDLQTESAALRKDKGAAEAARQSIELKIAELGETVKTQAALLSSLSEEVRTLRRSELTYRQRDIEQNDRISDLESVREVLEQTNRALQEQLAEMRRAADEARSGVASLASGTGQPFEHTGRLIAGRVDEVATDLANGSRLAKVNVGSNDQVREGMIFYIVRGQEYLGKLVVLKADLKFAIGRIDGNVGKPGEIRADDRVLSRLQ